MLLKEIMDHLQIMQVNLMEMDIEILGIELLEDPYLFQFGLNLMKQGVGNESWILEMDQNPIIF